MSLPKYRDYKATGIDWLPKIPAHWTVCALKRVASLQSGESITAEEIEDAGAYPVYGGNGLRGFTTAFTHEGRFALIGRQGALCGNVNYSQGKFWASEHAVVATPVKPVNTTWLGEMLRSMNLNQYSISAAQPGLSVELISRITVPYPPLDEQAAIAVFLERATAKIDALIAEQEKLIVLLAEKRLATISHVATRGLYPGALLKESGMAWLGAVPAHWSVKPLKALFRQQKRQSFPEKNVLSVYRDFGVIRKDSRTDNFNKTPDDLSLYQLVEPNDLVVNKMKGWQGSLGISQLEGITSPDYMVFTPLHSEDSEYLHILLRSVSMVSTYRSISNGIRPAQWRLEPDAFLRLKVFLPPIEEQQAIVNFCRGEMRKLDLLTAETEAMLILLKERRSAIITAVVTGQVDVRDAAGQATTAVEVMAA
jgi:type I restriction enzyme S subunit